MVKGHWSTAGFDWACLGEEEQNGLFSSDGHPIFDVGGHPSYLFKKALLTPSKATRCSHLPPSLPDLFCAFLPEPGTPMGTQMHTDPTGCVRQLSAT